MIPEHTQRAINNYVEMGVPPGGFLYALLTNDLLRAAMCADEDNRKSLAEIVLWCFQNIPASSWGSPEKVAQWLKQDFDEEVTP